MKKIEIKTVETEYWNEMKNVMEDMIELDGKKIIGSILWIT
jgi:hypothetical protein